MRLLPKVARCLQGLFGIIEEMSSSSNLQGGSITASVASLAKEVILETSATVTTGIMRKYTEIEHVFESF